jgi:heme A synthase
MAYNRPLILFRCRKMYLRLVLATCVLAFCAVVLSAYARLSDAGLGCANWPACYEENALKERQPPQAGAARGHTSWQWKLHSQVVQLLGLLAIAVCGLAWKKRKELRQSPLLPTLLLGLMVFLAAFGIWAFAHLTRPVIVSVHLAGGIAMLILLVWIVLRQMALPAAVDPGEARNWRVFSLLGIALVLIQIMLGGWVSSNFAALACTGFPLCQGALLPPMDFSYSLDHSGLPLSAELDASGRRAAYPCLHGLAVLRDHGGERLAQHRQGCAGIGRAPVCTRYRQCTAWVAAAGCGAAQRGGDAAAGHAGGVELQASEDVTAA